MNLEVPNCFSRSGSSARMAPGLPIFNAQLLTASCVALPGNWRLFHWPSFNLSFNSFLSSILSSVPFFNFRPSPPPPKKIRPMPLTAEPAMPPVAVVPTAATFFLPRFAGGFQFVLFDLDVLRIDAHQPGLDRLLAGRSFNLLELQRKMSFVGILDPAFQLCRRV